MFISPFPKITAPVLGESAQEAKAQVPITAEQLAEEFFKSVVDDNTDDEYNTWAKVKAAPETANVVSAWMRLAQIALNTIAKHNK